MRRLYVAPLQVHIDHKDIRPGNMVYWMGLYTPGEEAVWEASGKPVVITAAFYNDRHQDMWGDNPQVTVLPHPIYEPAMLLSETMQKPENVANTHNGVAALAAVQLFALQHTHNIRDVHTALVRWHPGFRLRVR